MSGKESSHRQSRHIEDLASRPEIRLPVSYVYRILQEEQYSPFIGSSTIHFLLNVLDYLTDYILELEAHNNHSMLITPEHVEKVLEKNHQFHRSGGTYINSLTQPPNPIDHE
uniref:Histone H2A n=1 Tax=Sciurus vulgaris TaxID=55149 RepID=A0A8D2JP98_SCIVU